MIKNPYSDDEPSELDDEDFGQLPTAPGHRQADVKLYDPDLHTMVGKMAASISRGHRRITNLEKALIDINRNVRRTRTFVASIVLMLQGLLEFLRHLPPSN